MKQVMIIFLGVLAGLIAFAGFIIVNERRNKKRLLRQIQQRYGKPSDREYTEAELESIANYFRRHEKEQPVVDDITWNDLDMDLIFMLLNQTDSSMGEEYLYYMLRTPAMKQETLLERKRLIDYFSSHKEEREQLQMYLAAAGKSQGVSISKYIYRLHDLELRSSVPHILSALGLIAALLLAIFYPAVGIIVSFGVIAHNLIRYFKVKAELENYFISVSYLIRVVRSAAGTEKLDQPEIADYITRITAAAKQMKDFTRNSRVVTDSGKATGSIETIIMDYIRMLFHVDIIKFNSMVKELQQHIGDVETIIDTMGLLESCIATASFREMLSVWCEPELKEQQEAFIEAENVYHPLIAEPVANSADADRSVLITGSNASGKSTFLKTLAINAILAQSVYTCTATAYRSCFFRIYSSMALQDNLMAKESYFIVEIKSLQRIIEATKAEVPVLCFVDEVLRGTNTVERISASAQILKSLWQPHVLCFAATHDIELTYLLEDYYKNYHFQEEISDNDILFNYQIYEGRAISRNAIRLLGIIGYDEDIIEKAERMAADFMTTGEWQLTD